MDPTREQKATVAFLKKAFGSNVIKAYQPRVSDGMLRVEATAIAGTWQWLINPDGVLVHASMEMTLFTEGKDVTTTGPAASPRNAQDDNDT